MSSSPALLQLISRFFIGLFVTLYHLAAFIIPVRPFYWIITLVIRTIRQRRESAKLVQRVDELAVKLQARAPQLDVSQFPPELLLYIFSYHEARISLNTFRERKIRELCGRFSHDKTRTYYPLFSSLLMTLSPGFMSDQQMEQIVKNPFFRFVTSWARCINLQLAAEGLNASSADVLLKHMPLRRDTCLHIESDYMIHHNVSKFQQFVKSFRFDQNRQSVLLDMPELSVSALVQMFPNITSLSIPELTLNFDFRTIAKSKITDLDIEVNQNMLHQVLTQVPRLSTLRASPFSADEARLDFSSSASDDELSGCIHLKHLTLNTFDVCGVPMIPNLESLDLLKCREGTPLLGGISRLTKLRSLAFNLGDLSKPRDDLQELLLLQNLSSLTIGGYHRPCEANLAVLKALVVRSSKPLQSLTLQAENYPLRLDQSDLLDLASSLRSFTLESCEILPAEVDYHELVMRLAERSNGRLRSLRLITAEASPSDRRLFYANVQRRLIDTGLLDSFDAYPLDQTNIASFRV